MFQKFSSILFGEALEEASVSHARVGFSKNQEDEEEDWIFVNYLAKACSSACEDELLEGCSESGDAPDCPLRCSSCSSLDSAVDGELEDGGFLHVEEEEEEEECNLEESWFITPPPCFTAGGGAPVLLETSPLENLLIEHPSMSVYAVHSAHHHHNHQRLLKEHPPEPSMLRTDLQHRPTNTPGFYAATLSTTRPNFLEEATGSRPAKKVRDRLQQQQLSRNGLRRLNLLRDGGARQAKATAGHVHQPGQRQYNY